MSSEERPFDKKIEELANSLADRALGNLPVDPEIRDLFKALATYYSSSRKLDKVVRDDDATKSGNFAGIKDRINKASAN